MPLITPTIDVATVKDVPRVLWSNVASGDTFDPLVLKQQFGLAGAIQVSGTFGAASVTFLVSNDNVNYFPAKDISNTAIAFTAGGIAEISLSAVYIRPAITGTGASGITITLVTRGSNSV